MITKGTKFCVMGTTGKTEGRFKVMAEDFSKLMTCTKLQLQENTKKDTYPGIFTKANNIQSAENQSKARIPGNWNCDLESGQEPGLLSIEAAGLHLSARSDFLWVCALVSALYFLLIPVIHL